jgi:hypothetical protein
MGVKCDLPHQRKEGREQNAEKTDEVTGGWIKLHNEELQ